MASTEDASAGQDEPPPEEERCRALTEDGERCTRLATDGAFCYQHDEDDPIIDDESSEGNDSGADADDDSADANDDSADANDDSADANDDSANDNPTDDGDSGGDADESSSGQDDASSVMAVRSAVIEVAGDLIGRPLDGVVEVGQTEDGWRAVVEVVERRAVPDTQDILGQYELMLESPENVTGYRRTGRYRRADTGSDEF